MIRVRKGSCLHCWPSPRLFARNICKGCLILLMLNRATDHLKMIYSNRMSSHRRFIVSCLQAGMMVGIVSIFIAGWAVRWRLQYSTDELLWTFGSTLLISICLPQWKKHVHQSRESYHIDDNFAPGSQRSRKTWAQKIRTENDEAFKSRISVNT